MTAFRHSLFAAAICSLSATLVQANSFDIVNGTEATASAYPWVVTLSIAAAGGGSGRCGGSVISETWVLSAAHCFDASAIAQPSGVTVTVGRQKISDSNGQVITAKRVINHPDYNSTTTDNDIALVELSTPVTAAKPIRLAGPVQPLTAGISARALGRGTLAAAASYAAQALGLKADCSKDLASCLAEAKAKGTADKDVLRAFLLANGLKDPTLGLGYADLLKAAQTLDASIGSSAGYDAVYAALAKGNSLIDLVNIAIAASGSTDELRQVDLPLVDQAACAAATNFSLTANMFCAGFTNQPKDTCQGDSGGPLVIRNRQDSDWLQIGLVSFGGACATNPGVYAKVANYLDFVAQYVPHFNDERLFAWGESIAASILKPAGNERSITVANYWARCYTSSGACLGTDASNLYFYSGQIQSLGPLKGWYDQAKAAGY